jgi:histidine triad (HIT) family protein
MTIRPSNECIFCKIITGEGKSFIVYEDTHCIAFLDKRPVFLGHCLVLTKMHVDTFYDLSEAQVKSLFVVAQKVGKAVEKGMKAQGSFIGINNIVSQSVPHCHIHIVPRNKGDGLRGFFWPRTTYNSKEVMLAIQNTIKKFL